MKSVVGQEGATSKGETTATAVVSNRRMETAVRPRRSLDELVDRVIEALFAEEEGACGEERDANDP